MTKKIAPKSNWLTFEKAAAKLAAVTDRYALKEFVPSKKIKATFIEVATGKEVQKKFNETIQCLKRNPNYIVCPTKDELSEIRRRGAKIAKARSLEKYGADNVARVKEVQQRINATRISKGLTKVTSCGKTASDIVNELGLSYSTVQTAFKDKGPDEGYEFCKELKVGTRAELIVKQFLDENNLAYIRNKQLAGTRYRPDFLVEDRKIIVECDGLYWHSDDYKGRSYHIQKAKVFRDAGYRAYFFREDELRDNNKHIPLSILSHGLNLTTNKMFARNCTIKELDIDLSQYHLMGHGSGRVFALLFENTPVAFMQVKWVNKSKGLVEISRFCTVPNTSVIGGFSKLAQHVYSVYNMRELQTFIDLRYGTGAYLSNLGFQLKTVYPSFRWVDTSKNPAVTYHRMKYLGSSGYEHGLKKIWDCGQAKWIKQY